MGRNKSFKIESITDLSQVADYIINQMTNGPKLAFLYGDLGAGKTTLVKLIVAALGSNDDTSSPTYSLVNEYKIVKGSFYHIDLYRIKDTEEALDMGIEEYIYSDNYCFVEWAHIIEPLVDEYWKIEIKCDAVEHRVFDIDLIQN